jgi:glycosyltransferase involved in cell wall biosynthesis
MRIGFVIYGRLDTVTGGNLYDDFLIDNLRRRGHDLEIISLTPGTYLHKVAQGFSPKLSTQLLGGNFDVIIQDELCHPSLFLLNRMLRRRRRPYLVALVHHLFSRERHHRLLGTLFSIVENRYLRAVDGFIYNSATTGALVNSVLLRNKPNVIASPSGSRFNFIMSDEEIGRRARQPGPLRLLFMGNIIARKGLMPLLYALSTLESRYWRLTVVGSTEFDPGHSATVITLMHELQMEKQVDFLGAVDDDQLVEMLKTHQVFCMPFAYEGFGIAMLEAMSCGQVPIVSSEGAAPEIVRHGENGYIIAPENKNGVSETLIGLYHDRAKLTQLGISARSSYEDAPDWQDAADAVEKFLQTLVGTPGFQPAPGTLAA